MKNYYKFLLNVFNLINFCFCALAYKLTNQNYISQINTKQHFFLTESQEKLNYSAQSSVFYGANRISQLLTISAAYIYYKYQKYLGSSIFINMIQRAFEKVRQLDKDTTLFVLIKNGTIYLKITQTSLDFEHRQLQADLKWERHESLRQYCEGDIQNFIKLLKSSPNPKFNKQSNTLTIPKTFNQDVMRQFIIQFNHVKRTNMSVNEKNIKRLIQECQKQDISLGQMKNMLKSVLQITLPLFQGNKMPASRNEATLKRSSPSTQLPEESLKKFLQQRQELSSSINQIRQSVRKSQIKLDYIVQNSNKIRIRQNHGQKYHYLDPKDIFNLNGIQRQILIRPDDITHTTKTNTKMKGKEVITNKIFKFKLKQIQEQFSFGIVDSNNIQNKVFYCSNGFSHLKIGEIQLTQNVARLRTGDEVQMSVNMTGQVVDWQLHKEIEWSIKDKILKNIDIHEYAQNLDIKWVLYVELCSMNDQFCVYQKII